MFDSGVFKVFGFYCCARWDTLWEHNFLTNDKIKILPVKKQTFFFRIIKFRPELIRATCFISPNCPITPHPSIKHVIRGDCKTRKNRHFFWWRLPLIFSHWLQDKIRACWRLLFYCILFSTKFFFLSFFLCLWFFFSFRIARYLVLLFDPRWWLFEQYLKSIGPVLKIIPKIYISSTRSRKTESTLSKKRKCKVNTDSGEILSV